MTSPPSTDSAGPVMPILWKLFRQAGWAPFLIVVVHRIVLVSGLREYRVCDWALHFSGGLTIAFFLFHVIPLLEAKLGKLSAAARLLLTYTSAVSIAAFWELAEFAASLSKGTVLQHSLSETMIDLFNGCLGAAVTVVGLMLFHPVWKLRSKDENLQDHPRIRPPQ